MMNDTMRPREDHRIGGNESIYRRRTRDQVINNRVTIFGQHHSLLYLSLTLLLYHCMEPENHYIWVISVVKV